MQKPDPDLDADPSLAELQAENLLLRTALEEMPHGLCMFSGSDELLLANRHYANIWSLDPVLTRRGATFADIIALTRGKETASSRAQPMPPAGWSGVRRREWEMEDGRIISIIVTRMPDGSTIALHEDVTRQRQDQEKIIRLARQDQLTGLPNRRAMVESFEKLLARNNRGEELAVMCLDLDRFKAVNDTFGHAVGDILLRQVTLRLMSCVRDTELVVRLGGDEFAVLQCGAPQPTSSTALSRRIISALNEPFDLDGHFAQIGVSIGVSIAPFDGTTSDELLKSADLALYRAKEEGRGIVRYFEPEMDARTQARRALEADLRLALTQGQFHLEYQPMVDLKTRQVVSVEALLRWRHPTLGSIAPVDFIALAEETNLIVSIGRWVLEQACRDAKAWPASVGIAVNASLVQFSQGHLLRDVRMALQKSGLAARRLEIEITESVILQDEAQTLALMNDLVDLGVSLSLDDFGTGYSSLANLLNFPLRRLKIDRSFIANLAKNPKAIAIVRGVAGLGSSLGKAITVEGVETADELKAVFEAGCYEVQGFWFSKPCSADVIADLIANMAQSPQWLPLEESHHV